LIAQQPEIDQTAGSMTLVTIVFVNFNSEELISNSVSSLTKYGVSKVSEMIVVGNSSLSPSIFPSEDTPEFKLISPSSNLGFGKANNLAAKQSDSEYLCFLNPDTLVKQDFFTPIIDFIMAHPNTGACAPSLEYEDGSYQSSAGDTMGLWYEFLEATMLINLSRKKLRKRINAAESSGAPLNVGWVSGACMIIKRDVFESVGGFTEDYFLNYEDIDLCKKLTDAGYRNYIFPALKCTHLDHKSFDSNYELLVYSRYESRLIYASIHYGAITKITSRLLHIIGLLLRIALVNFQFHGKEKKGRRIGYLRSLRLYLGLN